jgi:group II intron reverse transcriptase/maturase
MEADYNHSESDRICKTYQERVIFNLTKCVYCLGKTSKEMSYQPKEKSWHNNYTTGWSKGRNSYWSQSNNKNTLFTNNLLPLIVKGGHDVKYDLSNSKWKGSVTVRNNVNIYYYSTGSTNNIEDKFNSFAARCALNPNKKIDRNLYKYMTNPDFLYMGYNNIKSKPGNMTKGVYPETLDGINYQFFIDLSDKLKDESFKFTPGCRIMIPKASKEYRPLMIGGDKIVQEAMRMILNAIYEPTFSKSSHGFRPNRGCHTSLKEIFTTFKAISWVIKGDISKCLESPSSYKKGRGGINHEKLINLIEDKILDRQFTKLIRKSLKAGYFLFNVYKDDMIGTPQGSIISPILANIFLDQLDKKVDQIKENFDIGGNTPIYNPTASAMWTKIRSKKLQAFKPGTDAERRYIELGKSLHQVNMSTPSFSYNDPNLNCRLWRRELFYTRYAADWVIGIRGSKSDAENIKEEIKTFLESIDLTLSDSKTKITNFATEYIKFLGVSLKRSNVTKYMENEKKGVTQRQSLKMRIILPKNDIRKKLTNAGFIVDDKPRPRFVLMHKTHQQILISYNSILRGILNYYSMIHNYSYIATYTYYNLFLSCSKLLAAKFSLNSTAKVIKKFGKDLSYIDPKTKKVTSFYKPSFTGNYMGFKKKI